MDVVITARHFRPTPGQREIIQEKFGRLSRFAPRGATELRVIVTCERRLCRVEATLGSVLVKQEAPDLMACVEQAADRLKEKLRKDHEKRREHKGRMGLRDAGNGRVTTRRLGPSPRVRREAHDGDEIDVEQAAAKLTRSKKEFLVFVSSETGRVNVMYRRKDGQFGLIEPEASGS